MKGIIIASHGEMARGMLETSRLFFGEQKQIKAMCLQASDNPDQFVLDLQEAIKEVDSGDGVVVFCDMLFGTPCNCMMRIIGNDLDNPNLEVVTGVNLAMILQILAVRENSDVSIQELLDSGVQGITNLKEVVKANLNN